MTIHFLNRLHFSVVLLCCAKRQSLQRALLLLLGHLSFVLLQRPLQVLVLLLGPAEAGGQRSETVADTHTHAHAHTHRQVSPVVAQWPWSSWAGRCWAEPNWTCWGFLGGPQVVQVGRRGRREGTGLGCGRFWGAHDDDSLFLLGVQVPDQRVPLVDQYDQLVQQQLLSSLLGLRLLPVCNDTHCCFRTRLVLHLVVEL